MEQLNRNDGIQRSGARGLCIRLHLQLPRMREFGSNRICSDCSTWKNDGTTPNSDIHFGDYRLASLMAARVFPIDADFTFAVAFPGRILYSQLQVQKARISLARNS